MQYYVQKTYYYKLYDYRLIKMQNAAIIKESFQCSVVIKHSVRVVWENAVTQY